MACQRNVVPTPMTLSYLFLISTCLLGFVTGHTVNVIYTVHELSVGPLVQIFCTTTDIPSNSNTSVEWKQNSTKTVNLGSIIKEAYQSRHTLTANNFVMQIQNALLEDGGLYTCAVSYDAGSGERESIKGSTIVTLASYLPPLDYPRCSITPDSLTIVNRRDATFICDQGHSNPPVDLELKLERPDGTRVSLGDTTITRMMELEDNGSLFICNMTSRTFPMATPRNCSAGPINVTPYIARPPPPTSKVITSPLTVEYTAQLSQQQATEDALGAPSSQGVVIGLSLGIVVVVIIAVASVAVVIMYFRLKSTFKKPDENNMTDLKTSANTQFSDQDLDQVPDFKNVSNLDTSTGSETYIGFEKTSRQHETLNSLSTTDAEYQSLNDNTMLGNKKTDQGSIYEITENKSDQDGYTYVNPTEVSIPVVNPNKNGRDVYVNANICV